jgi:hypothetical protein
LLGVLSNPQNKFYFRVFLACFTRFSITPSKASLSPIFSSVRFFQYSNASLATLSMASSLATCALSSSSVMPFSASSVVMHKCRPATRSSSGCGGGPLRFLDGFPCVSTEVDEVLPSPCRKRDTDRESLDVRDEPVVRLREGRTSFFCFEAGRISSRSTGTPSETRNRRRMRERIQSGGARGGGATSCDHSDADRGV